MVRIATAMDASYVDNPLWWAKRVITVHPLGGNPMGRNDLEGVVDGWGRVFGTEDLWIVDGSVMPGPVGPNPALTIAAFADRAMDRCCRPAASADADAEETRVQMDGDAASGTAPQTTAPAVPTTAPQTPSRRPPSRPARRRRCASPSR